MWYSTSSSNRCMPRWQVRDYKLGEHGIATNQYLSYVLQSKTLISRRLEGELSRWP
jgi:hypothetical protein